MARGARIEIEKRGRRRVAVACIFSLDLLAAVGVGRGLQFVDLRSVLRRVEEVECTAVCKGILSQIHIMVKLSNINSSVLLYNGRTDNMWELSGDKINIVPTS